MKRPSYTYNRAADDSENWRRFDEERKRNQRTFNNIEPMPTENKKPADSWSNKGNGESEEEEKVHLTSR